MKMYLFFLCFLSAFNVLIGFTTSGYSDGGVEVPKLIQTLLKKEGISVEELQSNPQLIKKWKQDLYRMRGKQLEQKHRPQLRQQSLGKLPSDSYYQVII